MQKTVLCYGDSNTWGYNPVDGGRFPRDVRWPGVLAQKLGSGYYVIEEGLNGRTTAFDDPIEPFRNGRKALDVCLLTHSPIDLFVVMLGTNDTKPFHGLTPFMIAKGLEFIVMEAGKAEYGPAGQPPKILVVSPIAVEVAGLDDNMRNYFDETSAKKAAELPARYREVAKQYGCGFLDASQYAKPSVDGIHLGPEGHAALADAVAEAVKTMLG
ncbi:MAG: SGNH/GDSL hydrolase family protein [Christensenellaceae bacterium]|nr:SGNH/GDSL hydrolase family protein [Christensenellaceae bacterium]